MGSHGQVMRAGASLVGALPRKDVILLIRIAILAMCVMGTNELMSRFWPLRPGRGPT